MKADARVSENLKNLENTATTQFGNLLTLPVGDNGVLYDAAVRSGQGEGLVSAHVPHRDAVSGQASVRPPGSVTRPPLRARWRRWASTRVRGHRSGSTTTPTQTQQQQQQQQGTTSGGQSGTQRDTAVKAMGWRSTS